MRMLKEIVKPLLGKGINVPIVSGALAGYRYRMNRWSGLSPMFGDWERESHELFQGLVAAGDVVYDLGANTGIHTLLFSKLVGPAGKVIAFEPTTHNRCEIEHVCQMNRCTNVEILDVAAGDFDGTAAFASGSHSKAGSLDLAVGGDSINVDVRKIDTLLEAGLAEPDFLKVDIEGGEGAALRGASRTVLRSQPTMYIELHNPDQDLEVGRFLGEHGYRVFRKRTEDTLRRLSQRALLAPVQDLSRGWASDDGIWGCVLAVHPSREGRWHNSVKRWCGE